VGGVGVRAMLSPIVAQLVVDGVTLAVVEAYRIRRMFDELAGALGAGVSCSAPVLRVEIPKSDGGTGNGAAQQVICGSRGRCAGKRSHDGLVGTQPAGHLPPR
jgi:hypothetical protein